MPTDAPEFAPAKPRPPRETTPTTTRSTEQLADSYLIPRVDAPGAPQVVRLSLRARVLAPIRGGLSALGGAAAILVGVNPDTALLAWAVGAMLISLILAGDPRRRGSSAPEPLPGEAIPESWADIARTDVFPSTVGVATFTAVALTFDPVLAAFLAGILGGMALMTLVSWLPVAIAERRLGGVLYVDRRSRRVYLLEPRP